MIKKMGRPKLPRGEAKNKIVQARVTKLEHDAMKRASKDAGKDISEWARDILNAATFGH